MRLGRIGFWERLGTALVLLLQTAGPVRAQSSVSSESIAAELRTLGQGAATIFVGQIISIAHRKGVVDVTFRVEQPLRGSAGAGYTLHEWAGLWPPGQSRYVVGQRVLAFLHGASGYGFSSPVHGSEGLVPVLVQGARSPALLDIRRIAASVVRTPGTPLPTEADGAVPLSSALQLLTQGTASLELSRIRLSPGRTDRLVPGTLPGTLAPAFGGRTVFQASPGTTTGSAANARR